MLTQILKLEIINVITVGSIETKVLSLRFLLTLKKLLLALRGTNFFTDSWLGLSAMAAFLNTVD